MYIIDIETYDPNLRTLGDGSMRCDGWILLCGVLDTNTQKFTPIWECKNNPFLKDVLESSEPKILHNWVYDLSWLCCSPMYGYKVNGVIHDTMTRAALIDEYADLGLDACCKRAGLKGKNKDETIEAWYEEHRKERGWKGNFWSIVNQVWKDKEVRDLTAKYNEQDCRATWALFKAQEKSIKECAEAYDIECRLNPLVLQMKRNGIRIDTAALKKLRDHVAEEKEKVVNGLGEHDLTPEVIRSTKQFGAYMSKLGLHSPLKSPKGAESWSADALDRVHHPVVDAVKKFKAVDSLLVKYLDGSLSKSLIGDRIHCTFSPNKREDGGTITGRFACKTPNLQNISAREEKHGQKTYGHEMRALFIPEEGMRMLAIDYSQIEYLLLAHFAVGPQADWFRKQACNGVDFHKLAMEATAIKERKIIKTINYGVIYGMGLRTLLINNYLTFEEISKKQGIDIETYALNTYNMYHTRLPVIKDTMNYIQNISKLQGYIKSIGGRIHHKPRSQWVNGSLNDYIYRMTNYLIQGSAADILKKGLVDALDAGVFNELIMHLTVHDENVCSIAETKAGIEAGYALECCMNNAYKERLKVPMKAVGGYGVNWGDKESEQAWEDIKRQYGIAA